MADARESRPSGEAVDRDQLILDHLPLLHHIVGRMALDLPGSVEREDLLGFGMLGLIEAADAWDASRGLKFSTFAFPRIRGAVLDELRRMDFLPRGRREKVRELDRRIGQVEQRMGRKPTPEELSLELGLSTEELDEILQSARVAGHCSLDDGPSDELIEMLSDPRSDDPVGSAEWEETKNLLVRCMTELPAQEKTVIALYYGEDLMLRDIAGVLGVTESRVSQIHTRALFRLNGAMRGALGVH